MSTPTNDVSTNPEDTTVQPVDVPLQTPTPSTPSSPPIMSMPVTLNDYAAHLEALKAQATAQVTPATSPTSPWRRLVRTLDEAIHHARHGDTVATNDSQGTTPNP